MIEHWLTFDIGTTGTKAALVNREGRVIRSATREYVTATREQGVVEQHAADWWHAIKQTTQELAVGGQVGGIAITGQMQDLILVNAGGEAMRPVILYSDTRARSEAAEVSEILGAATLRQLTGNDQDAGGLLAKLLWVFHHEPEVLQRSTHLLLGAADYAAFMMTGQAATDTTTASTTGLMDVNTRAPLDPAVFEQLGITLVGLDDAPLMPVFVPGGTLVGRLHSAAAAALGLAEGLPVHLGPGDAAAASLGAGSGEPGVAYLYLGTSGWVAFTASEPADPEQGVFTLVHPHPERTIQVAPLLTAGGNLQWVRDLFGSEDYPELITQAMQRPSGDLLYLPYLNGERAPIRDPLARGAFIGLNASHEKPDLYRAVLEGVIFAYRHALDALMPEVPAELTLTGGGTRSRQWCQLFSDIINIPVDVAADAENVGVRGAMLAAQVASHERADYAPAGFFPVAATLHPQPEQRAHFDRKYQLYRAAYPALKSVFSGLSVAEEG